MRNNRFMQHTFTECDLKPYNLGFPLDVKCICISLSVYLHAYILRQHLEVTSTSEFTSVSSCLSEPALICFKLRSCVIPHNFEKVYASLPSWRTISNLLSRICRLVFSLNINVWLRFSEDCYCYAPRESSWKNPEDSLFGKEILLWHLQSLRCLQHSLFQRP